MTHDATAGAEGPARSQPGSQTLARGLTVLQQVATVAEGLTVQEIAERAGIHRTVASRLLSTLAGFRLVARGDDGRFRPAAGLAVLGSAFDRNLRMTSAPTLRALAEELGTTVALLVADGDEQVSVAVVVPTDVSYQLSFREGSRHPLDRGAAGIALLSCGPARPGERSLIADTRRRGWAMTYGEIEPNTYGLAVPVPRSAGAPATCLNLISHRLDVLERSRDAVLAAAVRLAAVLA
jgi:DNA-binding IclR family transcriptional regulator